MILLKRINFILIISVLLSMSTATFASPSRQVADLPAPDLDSAAFSFTQLDLTWTDNSTDETAFFIERSADGLTNWAEIGSVGANTTTYSDTKLTCDTTYYYRVRAYRDADNQFSAYSNTAIASTNACSLPDAAPVSHYTTTPISMLTWNRISWATSYEVQIAANTDFSGAITYPASGLSFVTPVLSKGVHYWRVRALGDNSTGSWSTGEQLVVASASGTSAVVIDSNGGTLSSQGGVEITISPGAVTAPIVVGIMDESETALPLTLPDGYDFLGAFTLDLGGNRLNFPAKVYIPAPNAFEGYAIVAQVQDVAGGFRLAMVNSASTNSEGMLETDSLPFPGVLTGGTYVIAQLPEGLGVLGVEAKSTTDQPVPDAFVEIITELPGTASSELIQQALDGQQAFVGVTDSNGFAAVPGALPGSQVRALVYKVTQNTILLGIGQSFPLPPPRIPPQPKPQPWPETSDPGEDVEVEEIDLDDEDLPEVELPPCLFLEVTPKQIPLPDSGIVFRPGDEVQLIVKCDEEDVTVSTPFGSVDDWEAYIEEREITLHFTTYYPENEDIVSVTQHGKVTGEGGGQANIGIRTRFFTIGGRQIKSSFAIGGLQVTVTQNFRLEVELLGEGRVVSEPLGIICPTIPSCFHEFAAGTPVELTARPTTGYTFVNWNGDCTGSANPCIVTMDAAKSVTARFEPDQPLTVTVTGPGTVVSSPAGIICNSGETCEHHFPYGTSVSLTASPASDFVGWAGGCTVLDNPCTVTMDVAKSVTAEFNTCNLSELDYQLLPDFNQTHQFNDSVHLGDNPADTRFIPPDPRGQVLQLFFTLECIPEDNEIYLYIDQYNADNDVLTERSFVTLNGTFVGYLSYNSTLTDLEGSLSLPVVTDTFQLDLALLREGSNTLVVHAGDIDAPSGDTFDDLCVTNIRLSSE